MNILANYSVEDKAFKQNMENCSFPLSAFDHEAHIRLAYVYLVDHSVDESVILVKKTLLGFLKQNGIDSGKYHETLTKAWLLAVKHFLVKSGACLSAKEFISKNPIILDAKIMLTHYSREHIFSDKAKNQFVQPDLDPIPIYA